MAISFALLGAGTVVQLGQGFTGLRGATNFEVLVHRVAGMLPLGVPGFEGNECRCRVCLLESSEGAEPQLLAACYFRKIQVFLFLGLMQSGVKLLQLR